MLQIRKLTDTLKLSNDGQLTLFPIGTGNAFTKTNYQNNYIIIKNDEHILIDCGTMASMALYKLGIPITDIRHVYVTHSHADHTGGIEEIMLTNRYVTQKKTNIIITKEYEHLLWENTLKGGATFNEWKNGAYLKFNDFWNVHRPVECRALNRSAWEIDYQNINLIFFRTMHYPDSASNWKNSAHSTGLIIDKRILFTADTRFDEELILDITSTFDIETIFHDVQFFPGGIHAFFDELITLPDHIRAKTLLMHYPDNYRQFEDIVSNAGFMGFVQAHQYYDFM